MTVGGPHISMLRDELAKVPAIFSLFDSAVVFDGEVPLLNLAQALEGDGDLSQVPNLVYRDGGTIRVTERKVPEKINDLPLPDFDGLPLDKYLAPYLALPLLTARGCYFGKCAFCNVGYGEPESFSQLRADELVRANGCAAARNTARATSSSLMKPLRRRICALFRRFWKRWERRSTGAAAPVLRR